MRLNDRTKTILINVITTLVLALILEAFLGFALRHPSIIPDLANKTYRHFYDSEDRAILQVTDCAEWDPQLFYRFKPGKCAFVNREFDVINNINSAGLRDDEASLDNPSVVIFGDSYTMGWGVSQDKMYPQQLETLSRLKILNAGISSFGTAREMKLLDKLGYGYVNTVIIQYHSNDYEENMESIQHDYVLPISPKKTYDSLKQNIAERVRYYPFKYLKGIAKSALYTLRSPDEDASVNDKFEAQAFLDILAHSNIDKIASRILVFKIDHNVNNDGFVNALDVLAKDEKYAGLNLSTIRLKGTFDKSDYFILDAHLNAQGHVKLAAKLNEYLKVRPESTIIANNYDDGGEIGQ